MTDQLVLAAGAESAFSEPFPKVVRQYTKRTTPPPVTFYDEELLSVATGRWFTLVSSTRGLIADSTYLIKDEWKQRIAEMRRYRYLEGSYIVIGNASRNNYFHWLLQSYASLLVARRSGFGASDHKVLGPRLNGWRRQYVDLLPDVHYVEIHEYAFTVLEKAVFSNVIWGDYSYCPSDEVLSALDSLLPSARSDVEKIYVSRADSKYRSLENEAEVIRLLEPRGYVPIRLSDLTIPEQIALFRGAKEVVAPHGAGLSNLVYSAPGTRVTELLPANYLNPCYWAIAEAKRMPYRGLINPVRPTGGGPHDDVMAVDVDRLALLLDDRV